MIKGSFSSGFWLLSALGVPPDHHDGVFSLRFRHPRAHKKAGSAKSSARAVLAFPTTALPFQSQELSPLGCEPPQTVSTP